MLNSGFDHFAEALVFVHGRKAAAEAAMHANLAEKTGDTGLAETWRQLESAVQERRLAA
jgi:hypothetical protein